MADVNVVVLVLFEKWLLCCCDDRYSWYQRLYCL